MDGLFRGAGLLARNQPLARPGLYGVEVERDLPYTSSGHRAHRLDVYRPRGRHENLPVVVYAHGGAFRMLSKDSHFAMGIAFARAGYVVFNLDYRLAPAHPFPAALEDCAEALGFVQRNAARFGGDPTRVVLAGESAGANLVTSLCVAACFRRPEPWAKEVFDRGMVPAAMAPACGILQVTDPDRLRRNPRMPGWVVEYVASIPRFYLGHARAQPHDAVALADPLLILESELAPDRPLPPFFAPVGTRDPVLDDTRRLKAALDRRGTECEVRYYPGGIHAFHAFMLGPQARRCWRHHYRFLRKHVPTSGINRKDDGIVITDA